MFECDDAMSTSCAVVPENKLSYFS
jgi:hypothetical protein